MFPMKRNIYSGLQHPLLLLVVGALISSYIIPLYTKAWQDHQKELELKTDLVSEISDATASILTKTQVKKAVSNAPILSSIMHMKTGNHPGLLFNPR